MKAYIKPRVRVVELSGESLLVGSDEEEETVEFTFTTETPSMWERELPKQFE